MTPKLARQYLTDGSFIERTIEMIKADRWRPHGFRYRFAWIQNGKCRVLIDNHHGKRDHIHLDGIEKRYTFETLEQVQKDFYQNIKELGGAV